MIRAAALALAALLVAAPATADTPPPPAAPIVGGWSELPRTDPELAAVARFVVPRLPRKQPRLLRIEGGERQVVAGINYRIVLQLTDRSRWRVQVWRKLDGTYQLTHHERIR